MIHVKTGPMFSSKSAVLIERYNNIWNKDRVVCFKPKVDSRDYGIIKSRTSETKIDAICIEKLEDIYKYIDSATRTIFIDEIEFLEGDVHVLLDLSINYDIDFYISGLNMTSEQEPFGIMPNVLAIADEIEILPASCYDCNKDAAYTYYELQDKRDTVKVGNDGYIPLCASCLKKRREKEKQESDLIKLTYKRK